MDEIVYWQAATAILALLLLHLYGRVSRYDGKYENFNNDGWQDETLFLRGVLVASLGLRATKENTSCHNFTRKDEAKMKPKITIEHGAEVPEVSVSPEGSVEVELVDVIRKETLVLSHNGRKVYWCLKEYEDPYHFTVRTDCMSLRPYTDIENDQDAFTEEDVPEFPDESVAAGYVSEYPHDDPLTLRLRYAIDECLLPGDAIEPTE